MRPRLPIAASVLALVAVLAPTSLGAPSRPFPRLLPGCVRADYASGGTPVRAERCGALGGRPRAALVVLHGCGGFGSLDRTLTGRLAAAGFVTLYVDYFWQTPPPGSRGFCGEGGADRWPVWHREAVDAAAALRRTHGVDPRRVGVVGLSMGGGLALETAGDRTAGGRSRVFDALVVFSSYADGPVLQHAAALPPTLLLSAGSTDAVPQAGAEALHRALVSAHVPTELHVWPHGSHGWPGAQGEAGIAWTTAFLRRYLGS